MQCVHIEQHNKQTRRVASWSCCCPFNSFGNIFFPRILCTIGVYTMCNMVHTMDDDRGESLSSQIRCSWDETGDNGISAHIHWLCVICMIIWCLIIYIHDNKALVLFQWTINDTCIHVVIISYCAFGVRARFMHAGILLFDCVMVANERFYWFCRIVLLLFAEMWKSDKKIIYQWQRNLKVC